MKRTLIGAAAALLPLGVAPTSPDYDMVVRGGRVLDGAGYP